MSDEEDTVRPLPAKRVHYGSLEETEIKRLATQNGDVKEEEKEDASKNININNEYMELERATIQAGIEGDRQALLDEFDRRARARQVAVSTDDGQVKEQLRARHQPICLFGEGPGERRQRLRDLLSRIGGSGVELSEVKSASEKSGSTGLSETTWYHEGPDSLKEARLYIADYSIPRAKHRLCEERQLRATSESARNAERQQLHKHLRQLTLTASQVGDSRPLSSCCFSASGQLLVTGSWSGLCRLWSLPDCAPVRTLRGHTCNVGAVCFHPAATTGALEEGDVNLASCGHDGSVKLWSLDSDEPLADIEGHAPHRVSRLRFHPSGRFLATCCHDRSWRLWDLQQLEEVLHQEGHSDAVFDVDFHCDGSLAVTGGMDAYGRVWDLRTGQCVMFLDSHLKTVLAVRFSGNGRTLATGSADHTCRVWDLRAGRGAVYTIPAHTSLVSSLAFEPGRGRFLVTGSYDNTAKIWSADTWQPLHTLSGHDGKVMSLDISPDGGSVITCSYDRTFKLWTPE